MPTVNRQVRQISAGDEERITRLQWDRYVRARDNGHVDYVAMAKRCDSFYRGEQWSTEDLSVLESEGRPAITINTILPTVNAVLAEQIARRADVKFKPRRNTSQEVADTLTKVYMQIADNNNLQWVEQQVFSDGLIVDRGYFDIRMDFSDHIEGEIRIDSLDPLDVLLDPDAKDYDPASWNEIFVSKWMTLDEIEEQYGKKQAERLRSLAENGQGFPQDSIEYYENNFGDGPDQDSSTVVRGSLHEDDYRNIKALRIIERQYKKMSRVHCFVDYETGDSREVSADWSDAKAKKFAEKWGLAIITKMKKRIRWTITCDKVVLHDDWSPYKEFTVIPYFAYFRRGRPFGLVRNLLSPQELLNKVSSQELHIVNTTANSGWMVETGSLTNMTADDLEEHGAKTGLILEYKRGSQPPLKIDSNNIPAGLDNIAQKAAINIRLISGVNESMLGSEGPEVSGIAIEKKQARGVLMTQVPIDNLAKTRHLLAKRILELIQTFYTEPRILQVTNEDDPLKPREEIQINQVSPEGEIINDMTLGEYDIVIGSAPARDSFDEMQFAEALSLRAAGVAVPDDAVIEYSHLSRKGELAKRLRQQQGLEPTPEQAEIQQLTQQLTLEALQAQVQKLQAEVRRLQTQSAVDIAKVQEMSEIDPQLRIMELQQKAQSDEAGNELRRDLAALSAATRQRQSETGTAAKLATTAMNNAAAENRERLKSGR